jgi:hypothetical protein
MICALLIFKQRTFPTTLDLISPWFDMLTRPLADVVRDLEAQQHRRFIKSHTPLDGLPLDERVTYVCVGRDPRDVALSLDNHMTNMNMNSLRSALAATVNPEGLTELTLVSRAIRPASQRERFWQWVDSPISPGLRALVHHVMTFWKVRKHPNVVLLHYAKLKTDLERQMRALASRLELNIPNDLWPTLVRAATFDEMRMRADEIVPNSTLGLWYENAHFFNKGTIGQWRQLLSANDLRRYQARIMKLAPPEVVAWLHQGPILD